VYDLDHTRNLYCRAQKPRAPFYKEFGRKLLRQVTAQTWLPMIPAASTTANHVLGKLNRF
jgi:hypothetical protein